MDALKKTLLLRIDPKKLDEKLLLKAVELLQANQVVAFPTETVYGLGGNAYSCEAIRKIFKSKGRPGDNPLIVHVSSVDMWRTLVTEVPPLVESIASKFWPGPLTIILPKRGPISPLVTAGLDCVGVRMPSHPVALELIRLSDLPLAAPSANTSGKPSPTSAEHVMHDLNGKISAVVDSGATGVGLESTVIDCSVLCRPAAPTAVAASPSLPILTILRPGGVTLEALSAFVAGRAHVVLDPALARARGGEGEENYEKTEFVPRAPGMKYTHYAPRAPVQLVKGSDAFLVELMQQAKAQGKRVGIMAVEEKSDFFVAAGADEVLCCGREGNVDSMAHSLYDALRGFDKTDVDLVLAHTVSEEGLGQAVMNRMYKAAGGVVLVEPEN